MGLIRILAEPLTSGEFTKKEIVKGGIGTIVAVALIIIIGGMA